MDEFILPAIINGTVTLETINWIKVKYKQFEEEHILELAQRLVAA